MSRMFHRSTRDDNPIVGGMIGGLKGRGAFPIHYVEGLDKSHVRLTCSMCVCSFPTRAVQLFVVFCRSLSFFPMSTCSLMRPRTSLIWARALQRYYELFSLSRTVYKLAALKHTLYVACFIIETLKGRKLEREREIRASQLRVDVSYTSTTVK
jgi:hypothetical protein